MLRLPRSFTWVEGALLVVIAGLLATIVLAAGARNDLDIFLEAAADLWQGENVYKNVYNQWYRFYYSPLFALLLSPLLLMPLAAAKVLWGSVMLGLLWRMLHIANTTLYPDGWNATQRRLLDLLILVFCFQAVRDNLNSGQTTILFCWACLEGVHQIRLGRAWVGALIIGVGIDAKLLPLIVVPYLVYRAHWKAAALVPVFLGASLLLPMLVLGMDHTMELMRTRWALLDPSDPIHVLDEEEPEFLSLGTLLSAYLSTEGGNSNSLALPRAITSLSTGTIAILLNIGRALLALAALWFLRTRPFKRVADKRHAWWELSYLLLCVPLVFPHQKNYAMFFMLPAAAWLLVRTIERHAPGAPWRNWIAMVPAFLLCNAYLIAGEFSPLFNHYKLLSFTILYLMLLLAVTRPTALGIGDEAAR